MMQNPSSMELREQGRGASDRIPTKRAGRKEKRDVNPILKSTNSATPYSKVVCRTIDDDDSIREYHVLKTLRQIPSKLVDHPRVSELNFASRAFFIISPRLRFAPLLLRVKDRTLDLEMLLEMQRAVLDYIRLLYSKGVAYQVRQEYMCPVKKASGRWKLYLGGWMEAGFDPNGCQLWPAEWKEQEASQCAEIERIFNKARATMIGRHD